MAFEIKGYSLIPNFDRKTWMIFMKMVISIQEQIFLQDGGDLY
jgi:hypothetical protein